MASQDLLPLPLSPCVICFLLLMFGMSNDKFKSGVSCLDTQYPTCSVTEAPHLRPFTHYILALQWPHSVCKTVKCKIDPVPKHFTIHGLWPDKGKTNCSGKTFDYWKLDRKMRDRLDKAWPTLFNKPQHIFLGYEWDKHGACSGLTQQEYFKTALELHQSVNVLENLKDCGCDSHGKTISYGPDPNKKYNASEITGAYEKKHSLKIRIKCIKNERSTEEMIGEIHFQVNKHSKRVESITDPTTTACTRNTKVSFPLPDKYQKQIIKKKR